MKPLSFLLTLLIIFSACDNKRERDLLKDVDSYIQDNPDSALQVLEGMDTLLLNSKSLRAHYSLLYTMALDKNYVDTCDFRLILPALSYYDNHGNSGKEMLSNYYAGRLCENGQDYSRAILYYEKALAKVSPKDYRYQGLIYSSLGDTYCSMYDFEEELSFHSKAYEAFRRAGNLQNILFSMFGLANAYHNNRQFEKADSLYRQICEDVRSSESLILSTKLAMADNLIKSEHFDPQTIKALYDDVIAASWEMTLEDYYEYAYILQLLGDPAFEKILSELSEYPSSHISLWWSGKIEKNKGNYALAEDLFEQSLLLQDEIVKNQLRQSVYKTQSEYYKYESQREKYKNTILKLRYAIIAAILLTVMVVSWLFFRKRQRELWEEKERLMIAVQESENMLSVIKEGAEYEKEKHDEEMFALKKLYASLYQKQFKEIGRYYDPRFKVDPQEMSNKMFEEISSGINTILNEISSSVDKQFEFEQRINHDLDNIVLKIRGDYPKYTEKDIRFICFILAGFDTTTISVLSDMSKENVRVKKMRIRKRLLSNTGPNSSLYHMWFE